MRRLAPPAVLPLVVSLLTAAVAEAAPIDTVTAREQLKQGYALKKEGRCADAVPHLVESERLDPQAKTLLNLAECEDALGHLVDADAHLVEARERARTEGHPELETIAIQRLAVVDKRLPRLTVVVGPGAPSGTQVTRDGAPLGPASIGIALPVDPGVHVVLASAGDANRRFDVPMKEGEATTITVSPLEPLAPSAAAQPANADSGGGSVSHAPAIAAFVVGAAGLAVGTIFAARSFSKWSDAKSECAASCGAGSTAQDSLSSARTAATVSDVTYVVGGVGVAAGIVLLVLESRESSRAAPTARSFWVDPQVGTSGGSLVLGGHF